MAPSSTTITAAVDHLRSVDPVVDDLAHRHGIPRLVDPRHGRTRFEALARSILYQQLAGSAAAAIHRRFVAGVGGLVTPEAVLACSLEELRACGLSSAKAAAVSDLALKVSSGQVRLARIGRSSDEAVISELLQVRGIGRWTAEMFLIFTLGRLDVWPTGDFGVRAGYGAAWGLALPPSPPELQLLGERFRPYRSLVAWYCWRAADARKPPRRAPADGRPGELDAPAATTRPGRPGARATT